MRKSLTEILHGNTAKMQEAWEQTEAAEEFAPLPSGTYMCKIVKGELAESKQLTPKYTLAFRVRSGEFEGRHIFADFWLTEAALPMTKRDLAKIGVTRLEQLNDPLPGVFLATVKLALRRDDDGNEYNRIRSFEVTGIESIEDADFAPESATETPILPSESTQAELVAAHAGRHNGSAPHYGSE